MRIETEAEAVAALEAAVSPHDWPSGYDCLGSIPDLWLAWLVRKGVSLIQSPKSLGSDWVAEFGNDRGPTEPHASPLVCAARAYLSVNGGDDERRA